MASPAVARKLLLKPGHKAWVLNAPNGYVESLDPLPEGVELSATAPAECDFVQLFVRDSAELEQLLPQAVASCKPDGLLWVCYLKGGKRAGTDLNRDVLWAKMGERGLTGVTLVAIDGDWSAMRFRWQP